jgi:hypothetical protein
LLAGLLLITKENGYNYTITRAYDPPMSIEQISEFPAVNVAMGKETCENANDLGLTGNRGVLHMSLPVNLECFIHESNNVELAQYNMERDIKKYFGTNYTIPYNGNPTAFALKYGGGLPFGIRENVVSGICGVDIILTVIYRQLVNDPTVLA